MSDSEPTKPYPTPTVPEPDDETLERFVFDAMAEATDGCEPVEPDGHCEHGHVSWLLYLELI